MRRLFSPGPSTADDGREPVEQEVDDEHESENPGDPAGGVEQDRFHQLVPRRRIDKADRHHERDGIPHGVGQCEKWKAEYHGRDGG